MHSVSGTLLATYQTCMWFFFCCAMQAHNVWMFDYLWLKYLNKLFSGRQYPLLMEIGIHECRSLCLLILTRISRRSLGNHTWIFYHLPVSFQPLIFVDCTRTHFLMTHQNIVTIIENFSHQIANASSSLHSLHIDHNSLLNFHARETIRRQKFVLFKHA